MPRRSIVPPEAVSDAVLERKDDIVADDGSIVSRSSTVYKDISESLPGISPVGIYTFVRRNRHNIWDRLGLSTNTAVQSEPRDSSPDSDVAIDGLNRSSLSDSSVESSSPSPTDNNEVREFTITIPHDVWNRMKPSSMTYKRNEHSRRDIRWREYQVLIPGTWTHVVAAQLSASGYDKCRWTFKRARVFHMGSAYLRLEGGCKPCGAAVKAFALTEPNKGTDLQLFCRIKLGEGSHKNPLKRPLSGALRSALVAELASSNTSPAEWRRKQTTSMKFGQPEPASIYTSAVLQKAVSEHRLSTKLDSNPVAAVSKMKRTFDGYGIIRDIGLEPVYVHYWSPSQLTLYNEYCINTQASSLKLDATGGIVKRLSYGDGTKSHQFLLYQGVIHNNRGTVPVLQMVTERHTLNSIQFFLCEWIRSGAAIPKEVVCDASFALLGACARAFAGCSSLWSYTEQMSRVASKDSDQLPACYLRLDINHVMKLITSWPCFRDKGVRFRQFYFRSLGQLVQSENLSHAKQILTAIFTTAASENKLSAVRECSAFLISRIETGAAGANLIDTIDDEPGVPNIDGSVAESKWAKDLFEQCSDLLKEQERMANPEERFDLNALHCPELVPHLCRFWRLSPLWCTAWRGFFGSSYSTLASSAAVESYFKQLKHSVLRKFSPPINFDQFISVHISAIQAEIKLFKGNEEELSTPDTELMGPVASPDDTTITAVQRQFSAPLSHDPSGTVAEHQRPSLLSVSSIELDTCHEITHCVGQENASPELSIGSCHVQQVTVAEELSSVENWRGIGENNGCKRRRNSYLQPSCEFGALDLTMVTRKAKIGLLQNAMRRGSIKVGQSVVSLRNTCAFDAIMQCMATAFCEAPAFKTALLKLNETAGVLDLVQMLVSKGADKATYQQRANILLNCFNSTAIGDSVIEVDCGSTVANVIRHCMRDMPSLVRKFTCSSPYCPDLAQRTGKLQRIPIAQIQSELLSDLSHLQSAVIAASFDIEDSALCGNSFGAQCPAVPQMYYMEPSPDFSRTNYVCAGAVMKEVSLGNMLWIDFSSQCTSTTGTETQWSSHTFEKIWTFPLSLFPTTINIQAHTLNLRGVIAMRPPSAESSQQGAIGHYVAFCRNTDGYWESYDDTAKASERAKGSKHVFAHALLYTV